MTHSTSTKFALVTGGTRGIGAGAALALAQAGYEVLATGLTEEEVAAAPAHPAIRHARLDVTRDAEVAAIVSAQPEVNHNYEREPAGLDDFNLWFVLTAADAAALDAAIARIEAATGLTVMRLPLEREYHIDLGFRLHGGRP